MASEMNEATFTVGRLARKSGVNLQTVRYYQRRGLFPVPPRPASGYRLYSHTDVQRIRFIKRAQALGFTLREIRQLLELSERRCREVRPLAEIKRDDVVRRMRDLKRMLKALDKALEACRQGDPDARCPLIETLAEDTEFEA